MRKYEEEHGAGCFSRAQRNELMFVLLCRDPVAATVIRFWAMLRLLLGKNAPGDAQIEEANRCADMMDREREYVRKNMRRVRRGTGGPDSPEVRLPAGTDASRRKGEVLNLYFILYYWTTETGQPEAAVKLHAFTADDALVQFNVWANERFKGLHPVQVRELRPVSMEVGWEELAARIGITMCSCGQPLFNRQELRRHWQDGHFRMSAPAIGAIEEVS